jgi:SpoVK/Ycf46/Vps4 family AAA+-type ATPase
MSARSTGMLPAISRIARVRPYGGRAASKISFLGKRLALTRQRLFFDEAESLFSKRTETRNANDRAANQQVSYLLQRIEEFPGVVILATNLRTQLDEAFSRRFQSIILFRMPNPEQRLRLWEENFKDKPYHLAPDVDLGQMAQDYELSGGSIINVLRYACLQAVTRRPQIIFAQDMLYGVRKELHKDGKFLS